MGLVYYTVKIIFAWRFSICNKLIIDDTYATFVINPIIA